MIRRLVTLLLLLAFPGSAIAAPPDKGSPISTRASELIALLNGGGEPQAFFAPSFLAEVPADKFRVLSGELVGSFGKATGIGTIDADTANSAKLRVEYENGVVDMRLAVDPAAPHLVTGLLITGSSAKTSTMAELIGVLEGLPGMTGLAVSRLDGPADSPGPKALQAYQADRPLAIGSAFKLVILAELVRAVNAGERHWADTVALDGEPLPQGTFGDWPKGSPVTLHTLAALMISKSDNSATDVLLRALGRDKVEAMLPVVGIADPARDRPFLGTLEAFKLKGVQGGTLGDRWAQADEAGRRSLMAEVATASPAAIDQSLFAKPNRIAAIEWFASPADLVRVMDWLRRNSESGPGADARAILALNSGIGPEAAAAWEFLGYKGGSEPGVMNMTFLLHGRDGAWYAVSGGWNDRAAPIDEVRFVALMTRVVALVGGG